MSSPPLFPALSSTLKSQPSKQSSLRYQIALLCYDYKGPEEELFQKLGLKGFEDLQVLPLQEAVSQAIEKKKKSLQKRKKKYKKFFSLLFNLSKRALTNRRQCSSFYEKGTREYEKHLYFIEKVSLPVNKKLSRILSQCGGKERETEKNDSPPPHPSNSFSLLKNFVSLEEKGQFSSTWNTEMQKKRQKEWTESEKRLCNAICLILEDHLEKKNLVQQILTGNKKTRGREGKGGVFELQGLKKNRELNGAQVLFVNSWPPPSNDDDYVKCENLRATVCISRGKWNGNVKVRLKNLRVQDRFQQEILYFFVSSVRRLQLLQKTEGPAYSSTTNPAAHTGIGVADLIIEHFGKPENARRLLLSSFYSHLTKCRPKLLMEFSEKFEDANPVSVRKKTDKKKDCENFFLKLSEPVLLFFLMSTFPMNEYQKAQKIIYDEHNNRNSTLPCALLPMVLEAVNFQDWARNNQKCLHMLRSTPAAGVIKTELQLHPKSVLDFMLPEDTNEYTKMKLVFNFTGITAILPETLCLRSHVGMLFYQVLASKSQMIIKYSDAWFHLRAAGYFLRRTLSRSRNGKGVDKEDTLLTIENIYQALFFRSLQNQMVLEGIFNYWPEGGVPVSDLKWDDDTSLLPCLKRFLVTINRLCKKAREKLANRDEEQKKKKKRKKLRKITDCFPHGTSLAILPYYLRHYAVDPALVFYFEDIGERKNSNYESLMKKVQKEVVNRWFIHVPKTGKNQRRQVFSLHARSMHVLNL